MRSAFGKTPDAPPGDGLPISLQEAVPAVVAAIEAAQDPIRRYEVLQTKAAQARARGDVSRAQVLEAKARAWAYRAGLDQESTQSRREWSALGKVVVGSGVLLAVSITLAVLARVFNPRRRRR